MDAAAGSMTGRPGQRDRAGAAFHHGGEVRRRGAAAAADGRDAELGDEAMEVLGQLVGGEVVVHHAVDHRGQAGVGDAGDGHPAGGRQMAQGLAHLDRSGGAVEADHVDLHGIEHGQGGGDLGAWQHAPGQLDRHLDLQRHDPVQGHHGPPRPVDGRLGRQQVEHRLDQEEVHAALQQAQRLLLVGVAQVGVGDLAQGRELGARAHAPGHPSGTVRRGELGRHRFGDLGAGAADLTGPVGQAVLGQHDRGRPERPRFDHVAADLVEGAVDLGDQVGAGVDQDLVAALELGPTEVLRAQTQQLQVGAHGAVEDEDALTQRREIRRLVGVEAAEEFGGVSHGQYRILGPTWSSVPAVASRM